MNLNKDSIVRIISEQVRCVKDVSVDFSSDDNRFLIKFTPDFTYPAFICRENDIIGSWRDVYDYEYSSVTLEANNFDTGIWKSTFTGENIAKNLMQRWVTNTISRIKYLQPNIVLEIGCGTGLLALQLVKYVKKYIATDFSSTVIEKLGAYKNAHDIQNLELHVASAKDLDSIGDISCVDTVVLNSVAQYFPNEAYVSDLIGELVKRIKNCKIFFGDIRDYALMDQFYYDIAKSKFPNLSEEELLSREKTESKREGELFIAPEFFINIYKQNKNVSGLEILPKRGSGELEMNRYRYDAVLYVGSNFSEEFISSSNVSFGELKVEDIQNGILADGVPENFVIKNYPDLRKNHQCGIEHLLSIEDFENIAHEGGYNLYFCYSVDAKYRSRCMDLFFYKDSRIRFWDLYKNAQTSDCCCNIPLEQQVFNICVQNIKNELQKHVSDEELSMCDYVMLR